MSIIENTRQVLINLWGAIWLNKSPKYLAIIIPFFLSFALSGWSQIFMKPAELVAAAICFFPSQ